MAHKSERIHKARLLKPIYPSQNLACTSHFDEPFFVFNVRAPSKVTQLQDFLSTVHDDVFWLKISHHNPFRMQVSKSHQNLVEKALNFTMVHWMVISYVVK